MVQEALDLAEGFQHRAKASQEQFQQLLNNVRQRAAFICLKKLELERARELFIRGNLDPREVRVSPGSLDPGAWALFLDKSCFIGHQSLSAPNADLFELHEVCSPSARPSGH